MSAGQIPPTGEIKDVPLSRMVPDATCLGCGCFCDDLVVSIERGRVSQVDRACETGRDWFLARDEDDPVLEAVVDGRPVETGEAIERAVAVLAAAKAPVFWGLTATATETVRATLELADVLGAKVILDRSNLNLGRVAAFQNQGRVTATLGEVKNRADLVIFWGVDPLTTHPRHWERYSVEPRGRFVPEGRAGRAIIVVDREPTATSAKADLLIQVPVHRHVETLTVLRMLLRVGRLDRRPVVPADGPTVSALEDLVTRMRGARYGAMFFQPAAESGGRSGAGWEAASRLVRDLNEFTRFVILGMGQPGNLGGAEAALTWQSGFLQGVYYRLGRPTAIDDVVTPEEVLSRGEADAFLSVGNRLPTDLSVKARDFFETVPTVAIGPGTTVAPKLSLSVALATSTTGFDAGGTVVRSDGVTLPLRPVREPRLPSDLELVRRILDGVKARSVRTS